MTDTLSFIQEHLNDDVRKLALSKAPEGVDLRFAIQQIDGRQRARTKLPSLCANPDIIFPAHLSVEQCSSEETARYKREILERRLGAEVPKSRISETPKSQISETPGFRIPKIFIDLTGGFGIDFMALSPLFQRAIYVEQNEELCRIARHNLSPAAEIVNSTAEVFLKNLSGNGTVFFLDPARRSESGARTFAISDCTPDVISLMPTLKTLGDSLFLKLSPMLDWHKAVADIEDCGANVAETHIVSVKNECKELLLFVELQRKPQAETRLFCKNDESVIEIPELPDTRTSGHPDTRNPGHPKSRTSEIPDIRISEAPDFLLIPNASIMKAGCFGFIAKRYGVAPAGANSHIFFSDSEISGFPGKQYRILRSFGMGKKETRAALQGIMRANISVRNFPLSADALRKRLKLKDGGNHHIFATTIDGEHRLFLTQSL